METFHQKKSCISVCYKKIEKPHARESITVPYRTDRTVPYYISTHDLKVLSSEMGLAENSFIRYGTMEGRH